MTSQLSSPRQVRLDFLGVIPEGRKRTLGQFMTPAPLARFMASLFAPVAGALRILDPGAGAGALAMAVLERGRSGELGAGPIELVAQELDEVLVPRLENALAPYACDGVQVQVLGGDFLAAAAAAVEAGARPFTHAILNPPYKKFGATSEARRQCRRIGLETVNQYAAFVALALSRLAPGGQLVAIVPRSFCNGPYYKPFRDFLLARAAIRHLHLFHRRDAAFREDDVLQENLIIALERGGAQGEVQLSTSTDAAFHDLTRRAVAFCDIVKPADHDRMIHIPLDDGVDALDAADQIGHRLDDLGLGVSTGPIVEFRLRDHLVAMPKRGTVPLLHPTHLAGCTTRWPLPDSKKANAIARNAETERWLFPAGAYTVVRRFSSKEERRRVVASVVRAEALADCKAIGFENHLNVFHHDKAGLPVHLAWGLCAYLNSSAVDAHVRRFHGHTQVNAADLRALRYPSLKALTALGRWAESAGALSQESLDARVGRLLR